MQGAQTAQHTVCMHQRSEEQKTHCLPGVAPHKESCMLRGVLKSTTVSSQHAWQTGTHRECSLPA